MEDLFDSLTEPIEYDSSLEKNYVSNHPKPDHKIPDSYRPYLFSDSNNIFGNDINAKKTNTKSKYWKLSSTLLRKKIKNKILVCHKNYINPIGQCLAGNKQFCEMETGYYNKIYDLTDIYVVLYPETLDLFLKELMDMKVKNNTTHIYFRIIFYAYTYLIMYYTKIKPQHLKKLANTMIKKIDDLQESSIIDNFFTKHELVNYRIYYNRYVKS